jgi:3D (Asp-Asp-Asp) domain-containing protein
VVIPVDGRVVVPDPGRVVVPELGRCVMGSQVDSIEIGQ